MPDMGIDRGNLFVYLFCKYRRIPSGAYLMGKRRCTLARDPKAALVNDARLGGFPATNFESYSQAADVVRLPEDIARRSRRGVAMGRMRGKHRSGEPSKQKSSLPFSAKSFFAWRSRWDSNPRASKG